MGTCEFPLTDKLQCGLETEMDKNRCQFHEMPVENRANIGRLTKYVLDSPRIQNGVLYLTGMKFEDIDWNSVLSDFHGEINFSGAKFVDCAFREVNFDGPANFVGTIFENTDFAAVSFLGGVDFTGARFGGNKTPFDLCTFEAGTWSGFGNQLDVTFDGVVFEGRDMPFLSCYISGRKVSFMDAIIDSRTFRIRFYRPGVEMHHHQHLSIASEEIDLSNLSFNGHFDYSQDRESKDVAPLVDFSRVHFATMATAAFIEANLTKALFQYSVLDKVLYFGCEWPRRGDNPTPDSKESRGRKILYDDIMSRTENGKQATASSDELVRLYVQLKRNFEDSRDYMGASDWFYREMECRRRAAKSNIKWSPWTSRGYRLTCQFYKLVSRYGENYWRPFWLFVIAQFGFSMWYLIVGIPLRGDLWELNYDLFASGTFNWCDIYRAFAFGFQALILRLPNNLEFSKWSGWPVFACHFLTTATLVPLFLLALRRKFRR